MPAPGETRNIYQTRPRPADAPAVPRAEIPLTQARSITRNRFIAAVSLMLCGLSLALYLAAQLHKVDGLRRPPPEEPAFKPEALTLRDESIGYTGIFALDAPTSPLSLSGVQVDSLLPEGLTEDALDSAAAPTANLAEVLDVPRAADGDLAGLLVSVAVRFLKAGDWAEAGAALDKALAQRPDDLPALRLKGTLLLLTDRHAEAVDWFEDLVRRDPYQAEAFNHLGIACIRTGRLDRALEALQQALSLDTQYEDARLNLGLLHLQRREFDRVAPLLGPLLGSDPTNPKLRRYLATAYWESGDPHQARQHLQELVRLQPEDPRPYFEIARCYLRQDLRQEAMAWLTLGRERCAEGQLATFLSDPAFEPLYPLQTFQREFGTHLPSHASP
jgi:tetratricopeptide (TPR) repeat protein